MTLSRAKALKKSKNRQNHVFWGNEPKRAENFQISRKISEIENSVFKMSVEPEISKNKFHLRD